MKLFVGLLTLFVAVQARAATTTVNLIGSSFSPNSITVQVGDTVHWVNGPSGGFHNVVADGASFNSGGAANPTWTYDFVFGSAGAFAYYCQIHGSAGGGGMSGVVNVIQPTETSTPTPTATETDVPLGSTETDTPTVSPTFTESPVVTATSTRTPTPTNTPGSPVIQLFDKAPDLILAPNPQALGDPVCLYSGSVSEEGHWDVYNSGAERVASLDFRGPGQQCWDTTKAATGLYYVDVKWILPDGHIKRMKQKVVLWR